MPMYVVVYMYMRGTCACRQVLNGSSVLGVTEYGHNSKLSVGALVGIIVGSVAGGMLLMALAVAGQRYRTYLAILPKVRTDCNSAWNDQKAVAVRWCTTATAFWSFCVL